MKAVTRSITTFCSGVWTISTSERFSVMPSLSLPSSRLRVVQLRRAEQRLDLPADVGVQPRHGGELGAVRDLVQRDPQAEVRGVDAEAALHLDDVRRHQGQPAPEPCSGGRNTSY